MSVSEEIADRLLGPPGAMLSGSKTKPVGIQHHTVYWNACVFEAEGRSTKARHKRATQIWHGDLDLTAKASELWSLAVALNAAIYVTPEHPWRFDGFEAAIKDRFARERAVCFRPGVDVSRMVGLR